MSRAPTPFIAVDGEAIGNEYVMLCSSDGETRTRLERGGLTSRECLEFLLRRPKPAILTCFGLGYDVNNWLRDVPRPVLERLHTENVAYWREYRLEWLEGRWFAVKHADGRRARVNEAFGFFQSSFVAALQAWGIGAPAMIERMKAARGTFTAEQLGEVERYCLAECELLVEQMEQLREACREAGIMPKQWIGAGSIAGALLNRQEMGEHHCYDLDLLSDEAMVEDVVLGAYFAGRIELLRQGVHSHIKTADLRSAYPAAALQLPSLDGARLLHRKRFDPTKFGVWRCSWDLRPDPPAICPFPARRRHGIYWPAAGSGWYHGVEVAAAIAAGYPIEVHEGYVLRERGERPFEWIPGVYKERRRLKAEGHAAEKVVKLGLNSIYGKLAQGVGHKSRPKWQSYFWAGYITAATRARVLELATRSSGVLMIATDGIFCSAPGKVDRRRTGLGSWELGRVDRLFTAQAGVYQGVTPEGTKVRSRGFFASEVDYDELRWGWELEGASYIHHYQSTRFVGLGLALMRKDFSVWRTWRTETRALLLAPERKGIGADGDLTPHPGPIHSEPYTPKLALIEGRALDQVAGIDQPLREVM